MEETEYQKQSRSRLLKIITKKIKTIMIGSLSQIEEKILKNKKFTKLLNEIEDCFDDEIRPSILNLGNNQIRALEKELEMYSIEWNRFKIEFKAKDE